MPQRSYPLLVRRKMFHSAFWVKIKVLSFGWLLLRLLKNTSCCFCYSRKNRCCFSSFLKILSSFPLWRWRSFSSFFLLRLYLELHHLCKHFFKAFHFGWGDIFSFFFFYFRKYPQKSKIISVCLCVFCTTQIVSAELNFSLWSWKKEKYENPFLITWQSYLQISFKYPLSDTVRRSYNLIPCSCLTKILFGSLYAWTLLYIL